MVLFSPVDRVHRMFRSHGARGNGTLPDNLGQHFLLVVLLYKQAAAQIIFNSSLEYSLSPAESFIAFRVAMHATSDLFESMEDAS